ncbi:hypothetical protein C8A00DRAFT_43347 [Chaetomidium leptoderma]|uniref:Uncharacterized protein n=1 Tax=Chaetomidium leptoderma TaxID=669021 RepID=A0AAN6VLH2_9PEZI|nr:hypothetical protein C8A00DRAFT_43347 [Chaetomidium leptoderma]
MPSVPTTREVVSGALVNIVLKDDQPTGRTVQGAVSHLLTRGNHPRGIKVRLSDGRVGRVQSMAGTASGGSLTQVQPDGNMEVTTEARPGDASLHGGATKYHHYHDIRTAQGSEGPPPPTQPIGLDAYIKPAKKRGKGKRAGNATTGTPTSTADDTLLGSSGCDAGQPSEPEESACPVCGDFTGDAAALAHHVQSHFDD